MNNTSVHKTSQGKKSPFRVDEAAALHTPLDRAAARRTLPSDSAAQAIAYRSRAVPTTPLILLLHSHSRHFRPGFTYPSLQRSCSRQVETLSVRRVSQFKFCSSQLKPSLTGHTDPLHKTTRHKLNSTLTRQEGPHWRQCTCHSSAIRLLHSAQRIPQKISCACAQSGNPSALAPGQNSGLLLYDWDNLCIVCGPAHSR